MLVAAQPLERNAQILAKFGAKNDRKSAAYGLYVSILRSFFPPKWAKYARLCLPNRKAKLFTIGLFGGSFDPIHNGHLQLLHTLHTQIPLSEIRLIPCAQSALRNPPIATAAQRIEMIKRATEKMPWLQIDDREIQRGGISYTIDTLRSIRLDMPHAALCCIMSMDQFIQFHRWKAWEEIPELAHIIVANRPGYVASFEGALQACVAKRATDRLALLHTTPAGAIFFQHIPEVPISSTAIRAGLQAGKNVSALLPGRVEEYIYSEKLYM